ncbi:hypothetical protein AB0A63_24280 [Lentzea sp. NPDC042327]|uniref:hypothetical protein n=1 Tax=Lentzea sp. NPDC042327 TaxID=3154801 RepID=UPI0033E7A8D6
MADGDDRPGPLGRDERLAVDLGDAGSSACFLDLVCPECGRVTTDADAPGCAACQTPAPS